MMLDVLLTTAPMTTPIIAIILCKNKIKYVNFVESIRVVMSYYLFQIPGPRMALKISGIQILKISELWSNYEEVMK